MSATPQGQVFGAARVPRELLSALGMLAPAGTILLLLIAALSVVLAGSFWAEGENELTIRNYVKIFGDWHYRDTLWVTVKLSLLTALAGTLLGAPVAFSIVRTASRARQAVIVMLVVIPFLISHIVKLYALTLVLGNTGLINRMLQVLGLVGQDDFVPLMRNELGVCIGLTVFVLPYMILILVGVFRRLDINLERAAQNLGANQFVTFLHVTLPLILPGLISTAMMAFALASVAFATPLILGGGAVTMIANAVYDQALSALDLPLASSLAVVALVVSLGVLAAGDRIERIFTRSRGRHASPGR